MKPMARFQVGLWAVVLALTMGACHSGGGTATSPHPFAAYRKCLEQHGVTPHRHVDQGTTSSTDPTTAASFTAARQACAKLRPKGGLRGGELSGHRRGAFRRCLKDHGVVLPTTTTLPGSPEGPRGGMLADINRNDPTVAAALEACRAQLVPNATPTSTR
jgi:hypothetical protein